MGWPYRVYIKAAKNGGFFERLLSKNGFEAVLPTFSRYDYGANASEQFRRSLQIKKIITNTLCLLNGQNISMNNSEKRFCHKNASDVAKKATETADKKSSNY